MEVTSGSVPQGDDKLVAVTTKWPIVHGTTRIEAERRRFNANQREVERLLVAGIATLVAAGFACGRTQRTSGYPIGQSATAGSTWIRSSEDVSF
jgi:hypothetical protein